MNVHAHARASTRGALAIMALTAVLVCAQGCAEYQVRLPDSDPVIKTYESGTKHAYFWGLWLDPQVTTAECQGQGINDVVIKRNYLQDLAGVLTLGIWMPTQVGFRCKAPAISGGSFPE